MNNKEANNMDILSELKALINEYNEIVGNSDNPYVEDVNDRLEALMQIDEASTRRFLAECEPEDFETACFGIFECTLMFGLPFIEYVEGLAEEKGWTDYSRDMISDARATIGWKSTVVFPGRRV